MVIILGKWALTQTRPQKEQDLAIKIPLKLWEVWDAWHSQMWGFHSTPCSITSPMPGICFVLFCLNLIKQELTTTPDNQPTQRKRVLCGGRPWESPQGLWGARLGLLLELHHKYMKSLPKFLSQAFGDHRSLKPRFMSILDDSLILWPLRSSMSQELIFWPFWVIGSWRKHGPLSCLTGTVCAELDHSSHRLPV